LTRKELNLAIFEGTAEGVLWQPRLETWIAHHQKHGTMPERYRGLGYLEIYDALRCSVRYAASAGIEGYESSDEGGSSGAISTYAPSAGLEGYESPDDIERSEERQGRYLIRRVRTRGGELRTVLQEIWEGEELTNQRIVDFPVKTPADLRVLSEIVRRQHYRANLEKFNEAADRVGHRAEPTVFLNSSGFTELIKNHCGLVNTFYLLHDSPAEVEAYLDACDRRDERQLDAALQLPCRIFNLGDHANNEFTPPPILKRYMIPRWQRISERLHAQGRFVHTHWDGNSGLMLPYLRETRLDGVEALPPAPMGDMTLEEIKEAVGETIVVLDLLPAIHFLPHFTLKETLDFARRVIDMFAPRLILGISDEISEVGQIEKVEAITELVDRVCGLAE